MEENLQAENIESKPQKKQSSLKSAVIVNMITMILLCCSQEPASWSTLSWFALVPWLISSVRIGGYITSALTSWLCGSVYFLVSLYWLMNVTAPGTIALSIYLGLYFVLCGFILRRVYVATRWSFTFVLPVIWVGQEYLRATVMTGFPWLFLSHTLHENTDIIQIADITGAYGVTFLAAMVNGFIADVLLRSQVAIEQGTGKTRNLFKVRLFVLILTLSFAHLYGMYRVSQSQETMTAGPVVAVVQDTIPQDNKESGACLEDILLSHMELTREVFKNEIKPDLVVWPETMVLYNLNDEYLKLADHSDMFVPEFAQEIADTINFDKKLSTLAADNNSALLIGFPSSFLEMDIDNYHLKNNGKANSAIMYNADGSRFAGRYDKMHRVPFGEYLPFKESIPWLNKWLINLTPYGYDYSINAGAKPVLFSFKGSDDKEYKFTVAICYEDVVPQVARKLANWQDTDFMLNISNDGWFVDDSSGEIKPTSELAQHMSICRYRAIENRIGIARSVNCGISGMIKPDGSYQVESAGTLTAENVKARRCERGYLTDTIWLDSRTTIYSKTGDAFAVACTIIMGLIFIITLKRKKQTSKKLSQTDI